MTKIALFMAALVIITFEGHAKAQIPKMDEIKTIDGVKLGSSKKKGVRYYQGEIDNIIDASLETVFATVMDFKNRCNNSYKSRRDHLDKKFNCKYHNKNLIETVLIWNTKFKGKKEKNETDRFMMKRYIYNRGSFQHTELAKVYKYKNEQGESTIKLSYRMVSDKEAKQYLDKYAEKDSAFISTEGTFILTQKDDGKTQLYYKYISKTDHWLLNKSMVVDEFFENMSKSMNNLLITLSKGVVAIKTAKNTIQK
jgi:hypothetical protein